MESSVTGCEIEERAKSIVIHIYRKFEASPKPTGLLNYEPLPTDIVVTTAYKAGTTLLQYLTYLVVYESGGTKVDNFTDINQIAPWIDLHDQMGTPIPSPCVCSPRVLKSHSVRRKFDVAGLSNTQKHIIVIRSPFDYAFSFMDFVFKATTTEYERSDDLENDLIRAKAMNVFARSELLNVRIERDGTTHGTKTEEEEGGGWFEHVQGWTQPNIKANTLILFYEDVVKDLPKTVRQVASFAQCCLSEAQVMTISDACSREKMANDSRFEAKAGMKFFKLQGKVTRAKTKNTQGFRKYQLEQDVVDGIYKRMHDKFGVASYEELKASIVQRQAELHNR